MHPISKILCKAYDKLHRQGQISFPLQERQKSAIDSVVKTVNAYYFGIQRFKTHQDKAVAYLCFIIKDHPVTDGNKRLAIYWFEIYCTIFDLKPDFSSHGLDVLAISIEKAEMGIEELMDVVKKILFP